MPCSRSSDAGPTPESCSSCGVPMEPEARMTSRVALTSTRSPSRISVAPAQRKAPFASRASCSLSVERVGPHREIGARTHRLQEGLGRAHAEAAALIHVEVADAGVVAGVEVVDARKAGLLRRPPRTHRGCPSANVVWRRATRRPRRARRCPTALATMTALMRTKIRQHVRPAPRVVAGCRGPRVVVARLATHVDHAVDAGAAAENLAARIQQIASVQAGFGLGAIAPVGARIADAAQIAHGNVDPRIVVRTTGFDEQHATLGIRAQTIGEQATRRAGADDHVVEGGIAQVRTRGVVIGGSGGTRTHD